MLPVTELRKWFVAQEERMFHTRHKRELSQELAFEAVLGRMQGGCRRIIVEIVGK